MELEYLKVVTRNVTISKYMQRTKHGSQCSVQNVILVYHFLKQTQHTHHLHDNTQDSVVSVELSV